jgi:BirA family transcriptional regulator, biotin operon repressor / biotin---[acetyl-CoA-carboxylase] ligase
MDINRILRETFVVELEHHAELGSTNHRCEQRAKQGASKLPLLVLADCQTAGRGRGANRWWTGDGSLAFSLLLEPYASAELLGRQLNCRPNRLPLLSLAVGVAVAEAIKPLLHGQQIGIHWPNDVIVAGRKLAGILIEVLSTGHVIIGIGINTNTPMADVPTELASTATTLLEITGKPHDHIEILTSLLNNLEKRLLKLKQTPAEIAADADAICLQHDKPIKLQHGNQTIAGICRGIAPDGALLLETSDGVRSFYSGAISQDQ